ncbi:MAG: hypothetical protein H7Y13_13565 [Sphingobacteriaceae bacterium]|nr:hypothetical protein [Sphingobacteriaceae bacterium]
MQYKVYSKMVFAFLFILSQITLAQEPPVPPVPSPAEKPNVPKALNQTELDVRLSELNTKLSDLSARINNEVNVRLDAALKDLGDLEDFKSLSFPNRQQPENFAMSGNLVEKVKRISKSYPVDGKDKLSIANQFGKVVINVWAKNEIKVDVEIRAFEGSDDKAQALLDGVRIEESKKGDLIHFKTHIDKQSNGGIQRGNGRDDRGVLVDYIVYMPSRNSLAVNNKFGSISLPDFDGQVSIKNSYGSLSAADLNHSSNVIEVSYGSASIGKFTTGSIKVSYGSLSISSANQVNADVRYGSTKIGRVINGGNLENRYGSLKIDELDDNVKNLIISADKGSVQIGISPSANFDFDVTVHMGGFQYPRSRVNITSKTPEDGNGIQFTRNYKGNFGKDSNSRVQISSNYGSVKFQ